MPKTKYDAIAMSLHWIIGLLMIFMIFFGEDLMGREARSQGTFLPSLHVSIGATILALSIVRLIWRLKNPPPPLPATMAGWEVAVSKITHILFYVLIIGLPLAAIVRHEVRVGVERERRWAARDRRGVRSAARTRQREPRTRDVDGLTERH